MFRRRRVPVLLQMSPLECGAACLAMILTYHGRETSVSECRDDCGAGRDGATALAIVEGGRRLGLRAKGYSVALADFGKIALPTADIASFGEGKYDATDGFRLGNFDSSIPPSGDFKPETPDLQDVTK